MKFNREPNDDNGSFTFPCDPEHEQLQAKIIENLQDVHDPEISLNVFDLGLIYGLEVDPKETHVLMTLTSPFCPVAEELPRWVEQAVLEAGVEKCEVQVTFDPMFTWDMMSEVGKIVLNMY